MAAVPKFADRRKPANIFRYFNKIYSKSNV